MIVEVQVTINGSKAAIWAAITNIENAAKTVSGIENIEVLEKPANGLVVRIPRQCGHRFHANPATHSTGKRPRIPRQTGHHSWASRTVMN